MTTRELLENIAIEIKRTKIEIAPYILALEINGFSNSISLKELTISQWNELKIPRRLRLEILQKLSSQNSKSSQKPIENKINSPDYENLQKILIELSGEIQIVTDYFSCLNILQMVIKNALENDISKHRVKRSNPIFSKQVGKFNFALNFLENVCIFYKFAYKNKDWI